jgi:hypothetical protein
MMFRLQYRDPLVGVLDYLAEVGVSLLPLPPPYLAPSKRNAHTIPWPLLTMMTSSSLNRWYVYVRTVSLSVRAANAHI